MGRTAEASPGAAGTDTSSDVLVDVTVPVYRRVTFLAEAIESVLAQSFQAWRLTVCDNGPGDANIAATVEPYTSDPRVTYLATGVELPVAENWTRAISRGAAPYVALLHDDDRWHPDFLSVRVDALEADPACAFAFGECVHVDESGMEMGRVAARFPRGRLEPADVAPLLLRECIVRPPSLIVRRSAYEAVGARFDGEWHYCDWEMWARLASRFPVYYVARNDSDFRRHARTHSLAKHEDPDKLVAMAERIEGLFRQGVAGLEVTRLRRARNRSRILLDSAVSVHAGGGWRSSGDLYLRALREYPPTLLNASSLRMVARSALGERLSGAVARGLRPLRRSLVSR